MSLKSLLFVITVVVYLLPCPQGALAEPSKLHMNEAVQTALSLSPLVAEIERNFGFKEAESIDAARVGNPVFDADIALPRSWRDTRGENELSVSLSQPIRLSHGKLRNRLAALLEKAGNSDREQEILELVSKVKFAFARTWLLQQRQTVLQNLTPKISSLTNFVNSGLAQGAYGRGDAAIFRSEAARAEAELSGVQAETLQVQYTLSKLLGRSVSTLALAEPDLPKAVNLSNIDTGVRENSLKLFTRARTIVDLAAADLAVANRDAFPELRPRIFFARSDAGTNYLGLGISFDLPIYNRNSAERIRKSSVLNATQAQLAFLQSEDFRLAITNIAKAFNLRRSQIETYRSRVLPNMTDALSAFEEQVRSGQGSVFQLWQTLQSYSTTQEHYLELWTTAFSDYAELTLLLGEEL